MGEVIDLNKKRQESIEAKTRQFERIFFQELIGCYSAVEGGDKILPIEVLDISETGCLIEIPKSSGGLQYFELNSIISVRLYFTKKSFINLDSKVMRSEDKDNHYHFGVKFEQNSRDYDVFKTFIEFISKFAQKSQVDNSSKRVYFL